MVILGIETSCDETSASLVHASGGFEKPHFRILSNIVSSQVKLHAKYGGVVPQLAAREHVKNLPIVLREAANVIRAWKQNIDLISVTVGPGLIPSLLVGVHFAKSLAYTLQRPLLGVNHLEGHIYSNWLQGTREALRNRLPRFPAICLIVSGGHTELLYMQGYSDYRRLGETRDDAAGEAFDKVARILGLGFPGGPAIERMASRGNAQAFPLPRPMLQTKSYDFSFSGLKTAVLYLWQSLSPKERGGRQADLAASFQEAVVETLVAKTSRAARDFGVRAIMVSGGVSANQRLRNSFKGKIPVLFPPKALTTDNAAMIAMAGYFRYLAGERVSWEKLEANANLAISR